MPTVRHLIVVLGDQLDRRSAAFDGFDARVDRVGHVAGALAHGAGDEIEISGLDGGSHGGAGLEPDAPTQFAQARGPVGGGAVRLDLGGHRA